MQQSCGFVLSEDEYLAGRVCSNCCDLQSRIREKEAHLKELEEKNLKLKMKNSDLKKDKQHAYGIAMAALFLGILIASICKFQM